MSEQFPEAVNNNYQVEQSKDSDLLIAQSRAFHSYENVKSNPATEVPNPPKTHGISYRETELGGQPFTVAETYPGNDIATKANDNNNKDNSGDSKAKPNYFDPSAPNNTFHNGASYNKRANDDEDDTLATNKMPVYGPPTFEENKDIDQKLQERFTQEFVTARDEYARLSAGRGRRTFPNFIKGKDFSKKALAEARENYDKAFKELVDQEKIVAKNAGLKNSEIKRVASASAAENEYSLTTSIYQYRMVATGRGNFDQKGKFQLIEPKTPFGRAANRFYDWWGKQDGKKGMLKKAGAAAGIGFVVGVPTALAGTILLGPIAGGAVGVAAANRLTKSWMVSKISERSRDRKYVEDLDSNLQAEIINPSNGKFGNIVDQQTNNEVKRNRKRMAKIAGMAAIGGFGGALVGDALGLEHVIGGSGHAHAHVASTHPNTHPASKGGHRHPKAEAANPSSKPAAPINHANTVNGNQFNGEYVSTVYEQHLGLHQGFTNMEQAANLAQQHHALKLISDPSNPNHFFYQTADGQESTDSVLKVLDKYGGKVKVR